MLRTIAGAAVLGIASIAAPGCIEDPDCGICDPHNLVLQSISGNNYGRRKIHLLSPPCFGERCPDDFDSGTYFIESVGPCETSEEALASPQGPEEYCKLAPLLTTNGVEFIFNNLLEPTTVELVRRRPDNPNLFEVYDWKTKVLEIEGPITRYNGDYFIGRGSDPDVVTRAVNLSCIDNLAVRGVPYSHLDYADPATDPCNRIDEVTGLPMKMQRHGRVTSTRGRWEARAVAGAADRSCDTPEDGVDTCCNQCDFILGTQVAKYGVRTGTDPGSGAVLEGERLLARDNLRNPTMARRSPAIRKATCSPSAATSRSGSIDTTRPSSTTTTGRATPLTPAVSATHSGWPPSIVCARPIPTIARRGPSRGWRAATGRRTAFRPRSASVGCAWVPTTPGPRAPWTCPARSVPAKTRRAAMAFASRRGS